MKKLIIVIVFMLLIAGYQSEKINQESAVIVDDVITVINRENATYSQNDLVYHDYGTGIKLSSNSKLIISKDELCKTEELIIIYAINLINNDVIKLYENQSNQDIAFSQDISLMPNTDGVFIIVAVLSDGEMIDLTPKAMVETVYVEDNNNGFIPLR
ncbi:MAG: hypothetical protein WBI07_15045 [Mobilitalea sp.]